MHFIAFISRLEEIADYQSISPETEYTFASLVDLGPEVVWTDPLNLESALAHLKALHKLDPFTAVLNRKEKCAIVASIICLRLNLPTICRNPQLVRDKYKMRKALNGNQPFPRTILIRHEDDLNRVTDDMFPCVLKPRFGFNSRAAQLATNRADLRAAYFENHRRYASIDKQDRTNSDFVVEEKISGSEHNVETLIHEGRAIMHFISDKLPMQPPYFIEVGDNMPTQLNEKQQTICRTAAEQAIKRLEIINGWTHSELKLSGDGEHAIVVETAARMGGGYFDALFALVYGFDRMQLLIQLHSFGRESLMINDPQLHAAARRIVVYGPSRFYRIDSLDHAFDDASIKLLWPNSPQKIERELAGPPDEFTNTLFEFVAIASTPQEAAAKADSLASASYHSIKTFMP